MKPKNISEINNYIDSMKLILKDGTDNLDIKINRDKNFTFFYLYNINKEFVRNALVNLTPNDFNREILSTNEFHTNEILYEWRTQLELTAMDGSTDIRDVYIKTYLDENNKTVVVISFHKDKDYR